MLRVLTVSTLFPNSADPAFGVFVENQTLGIARQPGIRVRVINPIPMPPFPLRLHPKYRALHDQPEEEEWKGLRVARPRMRVIPGLSGSFNPALLALAARPVLRRWREEGCVFDVVDAQFFYPDGPAAACLAAELGLPLSIKARGADIHFWGRRLGCRDQVLRAAGKAAGLLAVSASLKRDMVAMGMPADRIAVHYTGCDLALFRPHEREAAKLALGVVGPLVVSLGSLIPRKGHALVIEAMATLPEATLLVVGGGPEEARLASLIERLGLGARVRLLGSQPHSRLPAILAAADVMALASESEGLANAWVEALACGTPVVTPDVDGASETIDRPAAGRLLRERTPKAISAAIRSILADPPSQADVQATAERFTWDRNALQLAQHLRKLAPAAALSGHSEPA